MGKLLIWAQYSWYWHFLAQETVLTLSLSLEREVATRHVPVYDSIPTEYVVFTLLLYKYNVQCIPARRLIHQWMLPSCFHECQL